ncbi:MULTISPECIES: hypothetical protein [Sphingosinicellaceae]|uniref:hypothetical protein n=1 Tax=Sphingosinicellaceae TaxID=2820280 RepID=UPI001C1E6D0B|nr:MULTISPECIES: hypothetical protein [Polymorphobacter]QYE36267.1 hypothetical protein KZX46_10215 [Polymorphobacter sp. PAMC 29334]UAJ10161.1 hypothetical protein KTC28_18170 [Polymorphobacter megasporae]
MLDYRFFKLNAGGVVDTAQVLRLPSDEAAVVHARGFGNGSAVEVWVGARRLVLLPPAAHPTANTYLQREASR